MTAANFLEAPLAEPVEPGDLDLSSPARFHNRELSWLSFNWRVLEEASNRRVPLLERLRFVSISAASLDEFYTVRVAGLRELAHAGNTTPAADGLTPAEQLFRIDADARALMDRQQSCWAELKAALANERIAVIGPGDLTGVDLAQLEDVFMDQVFPEIGRAHV